MLLMSGMEPHILSPILSLATFLSKPMWPSVVDVYFQIQTRRRNWTAATILASCLSCV